jgi:hypothetical protein
MFEARHRIDFLLRLCGDEYKLPEQPAFELGYLYLRLICETIALACLAVHGDVPGARSAKIRNAHEADYILNSLERLHDNFYPQPGTFELDPPTGGRTFIPRKASYMSKRELLRLYWECGEHLHRGNYEGASEFWKKDIDLKPIHNATLEIMALLNFHKISFLGSDDELWLTMIDPTKGNTPTATLERPIQNG